MGRRGVDEVGCVSAGRAVSSASGDSDRLASSTARARPDDGGAADDGDPDGDPAGAMNGDPAGGGAADGGCADDGADGRAGPPSGCCSTVVLLSARRAR